MTYIDTINALRFVCTVTYAIFGPGLNLLDNKSF